MTTECDVCGGRLRRFRHDWLSRCDGCGVLRSWLEPRIPDTASASGIDEARRLAGLESVREKNNQRILGLLAGMLPPQPRLLDVGCGPGFLLSRAAGQGFDAVGVEPDANVVEVARASGGTVHHGYFPAAVPDGERFDAIVFNDVLEHIPALAETLQASAGLLRPGGVLCLNCPDRRGFFYRTAAILDRIGVRGPYDRLWQAELPSPHLWYFTPANLIQAARRAGFEHAGSAELATIELKGLWDRIRYVDDSPLLVSVAAYGFSVAAYPLLRILPSDASACLFRLGSSDPPRR
jgi:SAM-dependent methyltransferase